MHMDAHRRNTHARVDTYLLHVGLEEAGVAAETGVDAIEERLRTQAVGVGAART